MNPNQEKARFVGLTILIHSDTGRARSARPELALTGPATEWGLMLRLYQSMSGQRAYSV